MGKRVDLALAILNGAVGQFLASTNNGLAIEMSFVVNEDPVSVDALVAALPQPKARVLVLVHGLMATERGWRFSDGSDYGMRLERDLGFTALRVRYNTGLAISDNGLALSHLLEALVSRYPRPIDELVLIGHSMGGLVIRSACHFAMLSASAWCRTVRRAVYVGTPHLGAPLERAGRVVASLLGSIDDPYTRLIAEIAGLRSDGIKDLGDGLRDTQHPVPLLPTITHCLIAGSVSTKAPWSALFGDAMVSIGSATHGASLLDSVHHVPGVGHVALAHHEEVYRLVLEFCRGSR